MKKQEEYCILAGEFAQICQTTRETLRYYQKQGILVPKKDEHNGYHYYSYAQISSYYFIKTFRDLGCSVADIKSYLLAGEKVRFNDFVDQQYQALLRQRAELEHRIGVIANTRKLLDQIRIADIGRPMLAVMPEKMHLLQTAVVSSPATSSEEISQDVTRHQIRCQRPGIQAFPMGASMDVERFLEGEYSYKNVFSFADVSAEGEGIIELPSYKAVVSVGRDSDGDIRKKYQEITTFLKSEKLIPCSDIYSLSIVNVIDPQEERRYLKYLFECVRDE